ncbi:MULTISPECIES: aldehyde dehydrogenase family protein [Methanosarcina]|uniref:Aldehyde dehydrogenase n=3 Tax=Methanosarcina barkeri TaxID=2208 RepID=A0A0E3QX09_METBA|nr:MULTISPECIES: aldehyde dehydrogenase family protein [Methanosarcina]AKB56070.1 Aldehyde dehydrogenase [Methanosarcina barkeri MS]AKJ40204.1 aldehyde dehydrogenase [Methanosarcina barkeri CM1]
MKMQINGKAVDVCNGEFFDIINPGTGELVDRVPKGTEDDAAIAVESASSAFNGWASTSPQQRARILYTAAGIVRQRKDELAVLLTREQGKPLAEAKNEIEGFAHVLEYYCGLASSFHGDFVPIPQNGYAFTVKKPLGVCTAIIPWNMPALIMAWKIGPALISGNTLVLKPASNTPLTNLVLASILNEAGLPPGVLNIVTGPGEVVGESLVRSSKVKKISFTGEVKTGKRVAELAAGGMKRVTLELGGSDPMLVCDDANLEAAVAGALRGRFYNCGQACTAVKRLFVFESVAEGFIKKLEAGIRNLRVGNGLQENIDMGPLNNRRQWEYIKGLVADVEEKDEGRIVTGGRVPEGSSCSKGYFFEPTLITDVARESRLLNEEVFGPVLPVVRVKDLDEAIEEANNTCYGLGASIWTKNLDRARAGCEQLNAGIIWLNQHLKVAPEVPFGGTRESGIGRENGPDALSEYLDLKTVMLKI